MKKGELFSDYKQYTGLTDDDVMEEILTEGDSIPEMEGVLSSAGMKHTYYQQFYKGIEVEGSIYTEQHLNECVFATSGEVIEGLNLNVTPELDNITAYSNALESFESDSAELDSPTGQLIIIYTGDDSIPSAIDYKLAYKFSISDKSNNMYIHIYVDANNGAILRQTDRMNNDGTFQHMYYGEKTDLDTYYNNRLWPWSDTYHLFANNHPNTYKRNIYTEDNRNEYGNEEDPYRDYTAFDWTYLQMPYCYDTDEWGTAEHFRATSTHYCVQKAWDFYVDKYNHFGMTGKNGGYGKHIRVYADKPGHSGANHLLYNDENYIVVGEYEGHYLATYDVMAHEFTHGVISRTMALPAQKASGAINEGFADIMGFMAERQVLGYVEDWTIGEDAATLRSFSDPHAYGDQPRYYKEEDYWFNLQGCIPQTDANSSGYNDACGVHTNSGVITHWFYLLSMGGSNSVFGQTRTVNGIGIDDAGLLVYKTMTSKLNYDGANETFDKVKESTLLVAAEMFGLYSQKYYNVCRAWWAVNVGSNCYFPFDPNISNCAWIPDSRITEFTGTTSTNDFNIKIKLAPNPAKTSIFILLEEPNAPRYQDYKVIIKDISGKTVFTNSYKNLTNQSIDIETFRSGIYVMSIEGHNWIKNIKFIKE